MGRPSYDSSAPLRLLPALPRSLEGTRLLRKLMKTRQTAIIEEDGTYSYDTKELTQKLFAKGRKRYGSEEKKAHG